MDRTPGRILDFLIVTVSEVSFSTAIEDEEWCQRSINRVFGQGIKTRSLTTDQDTQVTGEMGKKYS